MRYSFSSSDIALSTAKVNLTAIEPELLGFVCAADSQAGVAFERDTISEPLAQTLHTRAAYDCAEIVGGACAATQRRNQRWKRVTSCRKIDEESEWR